MRWVFLRDELLEKGRIRQTSCLTGGGEVRTPIPAARLRNQQVVGSSPILGSQTVDEIAEFKVNSIQSFVANKAKLIEAYGGQSQRIVSMEVSTDRIGQADVLQLGRSGRLTVGL